MDCDRSTSTANTLVHRVLEEGWCDAPAEDEDGLVSHPFEVLVLGTLLQELTDGHKARPFLVGVGMLAAERVRAVTVTDRNAARSLWGIGWRGDL